MNLGHVRQSICSRPAPSKQETCNIQTGSTPANHRRAHNPTPIVPRSGGFSTPAQGALYTAPCKWPTFGHLPSPTRGLLNGGSPLFIRQPLGKRQPWLHHHTSSMAYHHLQCLIWTTMPYLRPCNLSYTPAAFWRFTGVLIGVRSQNCCPLCHNVGWSVGHVPLTATLCSYHSFLGWLMVSTPLINMKVSWDDDIPNWMESDNPVCSKPPTSWYGPKVKTRNTRDFPQPCHHVWRVFIQQSQPPVISLAPMASTQWSTAQWLITLVPLCNPGWGRNSQLVAVEFGHPWGPCNACPQRYLQSQPWTYPPVM